MGIALGLMLAAGLLTANAAAQGELRFCLRTDPKTFDPLLAAEEASETVRYLTGGVLIRFNRKTQGLEPELADSWKLQDGGRRIDFLLRSGIHFSDGTPFDAEDVLATFRRISDPAFASAIADEFRSAGEGIKFSSSGRYGVSITFPQPLAGVEFLFDRLSFSSSRSAQKEKAVLGPFYVTEYKAGQHVLLRRNTYYWKKDRQSARLPYLDSIRLEIQSNRENELLRYRRGELDFIDKLDPELFERLRKDMPTSVVDAGPSLDSEFLWFNQAASAPIEEYKRAWFQSQRFRRAISAAIQRSDMVRLVYRGYGRPAGGPVSPSNHVWANARVQPHGYDLQEARRLLQQDGFRWEGETLRDKQGNAVEFSLITNAGSKTRSQLGALLQQDLKKLGIRVNFTPLEFQSLIERITKSQKYEACLLGFTNMDLDPNGQMNVWMSSSTHHAWNPGQNTPATAWEAEIDGLMKTQATAANPRARKLAFDRVQAIVSEQAPILYLVHPNVLVAVSGSVRNAAPSALAPHLYWNIEHLRLTDDRRTGREH
ncbi:MAG TPA: ABC transporter substrate-binding protein [Bryobacteraceae bacterium]|nr:ABC transporter substrate-binding protein [Bryobacteraceae bacterium]